MADPYEVARTDLSKIMNGLVSHKLSKREAMSLTDAILDSVWKLGYNEAMEDYGV